MEPDRRSFRLTLVALLALLAARNSPTPGTLPPPAVPDLAASAADPIYATYAAATERSSFLLDEGYAWTLNDSIRGARSTTDSAGDLGVSLFIDDKPAPAVGSSNAPVNIAESYADLVRYTWDASTAGSNGVSVEASFIVYSSRAAVWDVEIRNDGFAPLRIGIRPWLAPPETGWTDVGARGDTADAGDVPGLVAQHVEPPDAWTISHDVPHISAVTNLLAASADGEWLPPADSRDTLILETTRTLAPGASIDIRILRVVEPATKPAPSTLHIPPSTLSALADSLASADLSHVFDENRRWFSALALDRFESRDDRLLYLGAANLMRQVFYPPEGRSSHRWYVFSREPTWGWGHGGQVFHESLTMLALAEFDPLLAFESQYAFEERQHDNGYINYRTGAYLDEVIRHNDTLTSSAPWYAWINAELHRISGGPAADGSRVDDLARRDFLRRMYASSKRFYEYYVANRDRDGDGLAEWGGHAVLESVRDSEVAVWDEVGWPSNFEGVDVNAMLVMEERSLAYMAGELGLREESAGWQRRAGERVARINATMWDDETGFYYNVDRRGDNSGNDFTFATPDDLKRREIIGFLPLWAGVADSARAARLVEHLTDPASFWRMNGVPTLAADDPYYNPRGYWNGPVWVQWNYLIWRGLRDYGYHAEADELASRLRGAMIERLRADHTLYELYDPDSTWGGYHAPYIWAGIINAMME